MARKRKKSNLGDITDANVATIKRKEKAWMCNIHEIAGHRRVYCRKAKQKEIRGCKKGEKMKFISLYEEIHGPNKGKYYASVSCHKKTKHGRKPTRRIFRGHLSFEELFQVITPYLTEEVE